MGDAKHRWSRRDFLKYSLAAAGTPLVGTLLEAWPPATLWRTRSAQAAPGQAPKATLTIATAQPVPVLDPDATAADSTRSIILHIFDALVDRDPRTGRILPRLATLWRTPDERTWEFRLRPGVRFHTGEPLTARSVAFTFNRTKDPQTRSLAASAFAPVESAEVVNEATVRFRTSNPYPLFIQRLVEWPILPERYVTQNVERWAERPVGSGPYLMRRWERGQQVVLDRNEGYWGSKPALRTIIFRTIQEPATQVAGLLAGDVDMISDLLPDQIEAVEKSGRAHVITRPKVLQAVILLDAAGRTDPRGPFTDRRVRQAVNYGVNVDAIIKNILRGAATRTRAGVSPLQFGFDAKIEHFPYEPDRARQLLAAAGYPNGFEARLISQSAGIPAQKQTAEAVTQDLARIGVRLRIQEIQDPSEVGRVVREGRAGPMVQFGNGSAGMFDGEAAYAFIYRCGNPFSYYCNQQFEDLFRELTTTFDRVRRRDLLSRMQALVREDAAVLYEWAVHGIWGIADWVDWEPSPDRNDRLYTAKPK